MKRAFKSTFYREGISLRQIKKKLESESQTLISIFMRNITSLLLF